MGKNYFLVWRHYDVILPKNRQNDAIWGQKSISVKMLQMDWNFDTSSIIRPKTQKSTQKITMIFELQIFFLQLLTKF